MLTVMKTKMAATTAIKINLNVTKSMNAISATHTEQTVPENLLTEILLILACALVRSTLIPYQSKEKSSPHG